MRAFTRVVYGMIDVELLSALHIGTGGESAENDIAADGEGHYILPATAIAGVSLHYIKDLKDPQSAAALDLMGNPLYARSDTRKESCVYYYDAVCDHVQVEQRTGVGMDHARGVAADGLLYRNLFLSPGMTTSIRLQIFAANEMEEATARWIVEHIAQGYHTGKIAMGKRTSSGAGRFCVTGIKTLTLDLTTEDGLNQYLEGVDACYDKAETDGEVIPVSALPLDADDGVVTYRLQAYCPQGLIVKSGERLPRMKGDKADNVTVNMFYTMPQEPGSHQEPELHYYIPGTAIKGILRTYAERVYATLGLDAAELDYLFGPFKGRDKGRDKNGDGKRRKSCIYTFDTDLPGAEVKTHNRIKIDRVLGAVMDGGKMEEELLYITDKHPFDLEIMIDYNLLNDLQRDDDKAETASAGTPDPDVLRQHAEAVLFLAMRDLGTGRVTIGSGSSIGHGRLQGLTLARGDAEFEITGEQIDCGDHTARIEALLDSLRGGVQ